MRTGIPPGSWPVTWGVPRTSSAPTSPHLFPPHLQNQKTRRHPNFFPRKKLVPGTGRACCSLQCAPHPAACERVLKGVGAGSRNSPPSPGHERRVAWGCRAHMISGRQPPTCFSQKPPSHDIQPSHRTMWLLLDSMRSREISRRAVEGTPSSSICHEGRRVGGAKDKIRHLTGK